MSQESERVYTIPLGKVLLSPDNRRAMRAINMIKEFATHHMKNANIRIDEEVSHQIWLRGIKSPPRKIRVRMSRADDGYILVSPYEEESGSKADAKDSDSKEEKVKEPAESTPAGEAAAKDKPGEPEAKAKPEEVKTDAKPEEAAGKSEAKAKPDEVKTDAKPKEAAGKSEAKAKPKEAAGKKGSGK